MFGSAANYLYNSNSWSRGSMQTNLVEAAQVTMGSLPDGAADTFT